MSDSSTFIKDKFDRYFRVKKPTIDLNYIHKCCGVDYEFDKKTEKYRCSECENICTNSYVCYKDSKIWIKNP
jgi:hypothetical protein